MNVHAMALVTQPVHIARNALYFHQGEAKAGINKRRLKTNHFGGNTTLKDSVTLLNSRFPEALSLDEKEALTKQEQNRQNAAIILEQEHKLGVMAEKGEFGHGADGMRGESSEEQDPNDSLFLRTPNLIE